MSSQPPWAPSLSLSMMMLMMIPYTDKARTPMLTNSIRKPFSTVSLKENSFVSIFLMSLLIDIILISQRYVIPFVWPWLWTDI